MIQAIEAATLLPNNSLEGRKYLTSNLSVYDNVLLYPPYDFLVDASSQKVILDSGLSRGYPPKYPALKTFARNSRLTGQVDTHYEEIFFIPYSIAIERHFGHFLTETLAWAEPFTSNQSLLSHFDHIPILIKSFEDSRFSVEMNALLRLRHDFKTSFLGPNDSRVISASRAYVLSPSLRIRDYIAARHLDVCAKALTFLAPNLASLERKASISSQIRTYISRSKLPSLQRHVIGEKEIEECLESLGWTIFHPELHSLEDQLWQYASSSAIAGELGSAFHTLMLIPEHLRRVDLAVLGLTKTDAEINKTFINQFCLQGYRAAFIPCLSIDMNAESKKRSRNNLQLSTEPSEISFLINRWCGWE